MIKKRTSLAMTALNGFLFAVGGSKSEISNGSPSYTRYDCTEM